MLGMMSSIYVSHVVVVGPISHCCLMAVDSERGHGDQLLDWLALVVATVELAPGISVIDAWGERLVLLKD